jgi:hypothetical protein
MLRAGPGGADAAWFAVSAVKVHKSSIKRMGPRNRSLDELDPAGCYGGLKYSLHGAVVPVVSATSPQVASATEIADTLGIARLIP